MAGERERGRENGDKRESERKKEKRERGGERKTDGPGQNEIEPDFLSSYARGTGSECGAIRRGGAAEGSFFSLRSLSLQGGTSHVACHVARRL